MIRGWWLLGRLTLILLVIRQHLLYENGEVWPLTQPDAHVMRASLPGISLPSDIPS
jgi:hypothetical protein